jgi:hypothetical protein
MGIKSANPELAQPIGLTHRPGPVRKHHCHEHDLIMTPVKVLGKGMMFSCKEGCRLGKYATVLK